MGESNNFSPVRDGEKNPNFQTYLTAFFSLRGESNMMGP